ncbi:hypothetical protein [Enterococcus faecalis]|uniref:hypothetical protein n=1 Tax=Enterococcus faecalis TaxID=1351 RepID=UPI00115EAF0C|nr:hypothetical protein [Enterococcus faecalis]
MLIPEADYLRQEKKLLDELENSVAEKIMFAIEKGRTSIVLELTYDDGDLTYHGKNKDKITELLEKKGYELELIPRKVLSGGLETYPEKLLVDWS